MLEVETLSPLVSIAPGAAAEHTERWSLFDGVDAGESEASLVACIEGALAETRA